MINTTLTTKQRSIPQFLYRFRFLDRTHIQHFLGHKDKQQINIWLKDLTAKEYILRFYDDSIIGKNRIPAIYCLKRNGIQLLKSQGIGNTTYFRKLYYEKDRTQTFVQHCLLIANICCLLDRKNNETVSYVYHTDSDIAEEQSVFHFLKDVSLEVDLCFTKKQKGKQIQYYLVSIFDQSYPLYRIRKRIKDYYQLYFSNEWENSIDGAFPKILLIFSSKHNLITAKRFTKKLLDQDDSNDFSIYFAMAEEVKQMGTTGEIWEGV